MRWYPPGFSTTVTSFFFIISRYFVGRYFEIWDYAISNFLSYFPTLFLASIGEFCLKQLLLFWFSVSIFPRILLEWRTFSSPLIYLFYPSVYLYKYKLMSVCFILLGKIHCFHYLFCYTDTSQQQPLGISHLALVSLWHAHIMFLTSLAAFPLLLSLSQPWN